MAMFMAILGGYEDEIVELDGVGYLIFGSTPKGINKWTPIDDAWGLHKTWYWRQSRPWEICTLVHHWYLQEGELLFFGP